MGGIHSADSADPFTKLLDMCGNFTMTEDIQSCMVKELAEITNCRDLYGELVRVQLLQCIHVSSDTTSSELTFWEYL